MGARWGELYKQIINCFNKAIQFSTSLHRGYTCNRLRRIACFCDAANMPLPTLCSVLWRWLSVIDTSTSAAAYDATMGWLKLQATRSLFALHCNQLEYLLNGVRITLCKGLYIKFGFYNRFDNTFKKITNSSLHHLISTIPFALHSQALLFLQHAKKRHYGLGSQKGRS